MPPKFLRKYQPKLDAFRAHPLVMRFGAPLQHPALWHFSRRSVSGAVAIGLFAGLIPGPFQMLFALALAVPLRKNVPISLFMTLYTNPFTIVPIYLLAYGVGRFLLGMDGIETPIQPFEWSWSDLSGSIHGFMAWMMSLGKPLLLGLPVLAVTFAAVGYVIVDFAWRRYVRLAWRHRRHRHKR